MIGLLTVEFFIYEAQSLKDKRSVVQKTVNRLRQRFNLAVSETGFQDLWQRAEISMVTVSSDKIIAEKELQRALAMITSITELEVTNSKVEWL
ncbi:DUF503 domain-containing protein [Fictibacillus phosphorivorans]|uniref:DUF503 domain-containing protein n=1 Tax=Fictibacillus phosphorivorans TaxID=1221500 RepID=UPI00203F1D60|nr:DUF503 domain-containing protein [Fictibacillus phosphorivorans]MCM3717117.1 DUF503 domain-containing protein [Fictibacillus phosphorivorans]MCM3774804.1 DUF503 domain-containing protein [Fictibacillus phosphorivorans]